MLPENLRNTTTVRSSVKGNKINQIDVVANPINNPTKSSETKKTKEEYKKMIKDKNYSKSIDSNIPKMKYPVSTLKQYGNNITSNLISGIQSNVNSVATNDILTNRIKINKAKK